MVKSKRVIFSKDIFSEGLIDTIIEKNSLAEVIVFNFIIDYFKYLKNKGISKGEVGLNEILKLKDYSKNNNFKLTFYGNNVDFEKKVDDELEFIKYSKTLSLNFEIVTTSESILELCNIYSLKANYIKKVESKNPLIEFFDEKTMSVHIKPDIEILKKTGSPKSIKFVKDRVLSLKEVKKLIEKIIEFGSLNPNSYIEKDNQGIVIAQLENIRVVIVKPNLSNDYEITAVRPVKKLKLKDYNLDKKVYEKIDNIGGLLISGAPGSGKTTFAESILDHISKKEFVIKTIESPRDLRVSKNVTQLSLNYDEEKDIRNFLLLSRPDYSLFDEVRNPEDIQLFSDLRLTGVGMIGVIHSTRPIDSIQRLIGKIELGIIPQIVDTIIYIEKGEVKKILVLEPKVKVPSGMKEEDLARPIIEVKDFLSKKLEYEIYTYGEQTVVMKVQEDNDEKNKGIYSYAYTGIKKELKKHIKSNFDIKILGDNKIKLLVQEKHIPNIIGKKGKKIDELEEKLGLKIDVDILDESSLKNSSNSSNDHFETQFYIKESKKNITIDFSSKLKNREVLFRSPNFELLLKTNKKGCIKLNKNSTEARKIMKAYEENNLIVEI